MNNHDGRARGEHGRLLSLPRFIATTPEGQLDAILTRHGLLAMEIDAIPDPDDYAEAELLALQINAAAAAKTALRKARRDQRLRVLQQAQAVLARERYDRTKGQVRDALLTDPLRSRRALARSLGVCPSTLYKAVRELIREGVIPAPAPFERGSVKSSHITTNSPTARCPRCGFP